MKAMLRFVNGDRREIELDGTQIQNGRPVATLMWHDGTDGLGGSRVGLREFWLDVTACRVGYIRYVEVQRDTPNRSVDT